MNKTYNSIVGGVRLIIAAMMATSAPRALGERQAMDYQSIIDNANSIIVVWDKTRLAYINPFGLKVFGFDKEELIGKSILGTFLPKTGETEALLREIFDHPDRYISREDYNVKKNGQKVKVLWSNSGVYDDKGNVVRVVSIGNVMEGYP